jgi:hypothetical protein
MRDVALRSAAPLTCSRDLARFVSVDAPGSAPASNAAVETSPHLLTLSDPAFITAVNTALEQMGSAIQSACAHRDSLSSLRTMLQRLTQLHKEDIAQHYEQGDIGVDHLKSVLQELSSFRFQISNILVRLPAAF